MSAVFERPAARRPLTDVATPRAVFETAISEHSQELGSFFLAKLLGFELSYTDDSCIVEFTAHEYLQNPRGLLHGGVLATAMDVAMGHLVQRIGGPGATVTLEAKYHRGVSSGRVLCEGKAVHRGGSLWSLEARVSGEDGELIASGTCTMSLTRKTGAGLCAQQSTNTSARLATC